MMVAQVLTDNQQENLSRQQKRDLERRRQKAAKRLAKLAARINLPVTFDNTTVTAHGNFGLLEAMKQVIGFADILRRHLTIERHHNCVYSAAELIETMIDCAALGLLRFSHMEALKHDPGYQELKGVDRVADERTLRALLSQLTREQVEQLLQVNAAVLDLKADLDGPREVWVDFDDTVITVFGSQEDAKVGYNPRYHGRASYKAKVAFISGSGELVHADLCSGNTASNGGFLQFLQETLDKLNPRKTVVKGIRIDRGFFDEKNFIYLEDNNLEYVCKAKLNSSMWKIIHYFDEQQHWQQLDDTYATAEIRIPLPAWERARRMVFIRERLKPKEEHGQLNFDLETYEYQVIVTNMEHLTPEEVWHWYNKRCDIENRIDELKVGVGLDQTSQHEMLRNTAFMWLKILAYNLLNWFRLAILPQEAAHYEVNTIRRLILNVPGNIVGSGRYRHVRLAPNRWLEKVVTVIKTRLQQFIRQRAWLLEASG
jgi:hypothetical protein